MKELQRDLQVFEQKHNCVQEASPYCTAACPLHVDVRQVMAGLQKGRWEVAFESYRKAVLFPGILSRVCDQPCLAHCLREKVDEGVQIRMVERALTEHIQIPAKRHYIRPKNRSVAVVGAGLAGLSSAVTLAQKGYRVTVYEQEEHPGGRLLKCQELSPMDVIREIESVLGDFDVKLLCMHHISAPLELDADAVLLACDMTLQTQGEGIFVLGCWANGSKPAEQIALGKQMASTVERWLSGSPALNRAEKQDTELYTPLPPGLVPEQARRPAPGEVYTKEQAEEEAGRCLLCECKACLPHCLFLQEGKQYPKQYIVEAQQSLRTLKLLQSKLKARRTNGCNLCGLCKEYCPGGVDMSEIYLYSRRIMHKRGELPEAFHAFWLDDMEFSGSEEAFLCRAQPGYETVEYLFFPGCQMGGSDARYVLDSYRYLTEHLDGGVGMYLGCCGAPSEWAGYEERTAQVLEQFQVYYEALGRPKVILACPTCEKMFAKYHPEVECLPFWAVFQRHGLPEKAVREGGDLALFDPCSSRYYPETQQQVRELLTQMGFFVQELPHHGRYAQCCGYGGLIYASNPKTARAVAADRVAASPLPYVTYCVNCCEIFRREGKPTWHLLDLLFGRGDLDTASLPPASFSQRRENRRDLKQELLTTWWRENRVELQDWLSLRLKLTNELRKKMDAALILEENLQQAIYLAETTQNKLEQGETCICHLQIGVVTYWVIYRPLADGSFWVENAYSHRMQIEEAP